jgi:tetratricopeptide (TPR) repeat protein
MLIERIVYSFICISLFAYIVNKFFKTQKNTIFMIGTLQVIAIIINVLSIINNIFMSTLLQAYILIFGIVVPFLIFITEYLNLNTVELINIKVGNYYLKRKNFEKAITSYKRAIERNPLGGQNYARLGKAYLEQGDKRTAFDKFAKAIELNRKDYKSYYQIGLILYDLNKRKDALIVLDNALRIKPDYTPASQLLAVILCAENKYDEAINLYKEAIKYDPDNYELYYSLGVVRTELRDFDDAKECYEKAINLKPDLYEAFFSLGQIHLLKGELEASEKAFKKSVYDKDLSAKSYYQLAKVFILRGEEIKAISYLEYAINIDGAYRYKADTEPLFKGIKDYLTGLHLVSQAQFKLEQEVNEKVKEKFEKEKNYSQIEIGDVQFNYLDRFAK